MLPILMRLRKFLPAPLFLLLRNRFWRRFWKKQKARDEASLGSALPELAGSERSFLIERICDYLPFSTALEVGCGYCQNFHIYAALLRPIPLFGVDKDAGRISDAAALLNQQGIDNVKLVCADAANLRGFSDGSFDLIYSCGLMLVLEPPEIQAVLKEMLRVAKRAVLLMEQHRGSPEGHNKLEGEFFPGGVYGTGYRIWDFSALFAAVAPGKDVIISKVPNPIWTTEQWRASAHLIEVRN